LLSEVSSSSSRL